MLFIDPWQKARKNSKPHILNTSKRKSSISQESYLAFVSYRPEYAFIGLFAILKINKLLNEINCNHFAGSGRSTGG